MKQAKEGMVVLCRANGNMEHDFVGRIQKCYENSALVEILDYAPQDQVNVQDLIGRTVIAFNRMKRSQTVANDDVSCMASKMRITASSAAVKSRKIKATSVVNSSL